MPRFLTRSRGRQRVSALVTEFYREEFVKHHVPAAAARVLFREQAIADVETALLKIIAELDRLSAEANAEQVVSQLLKSSTS